MSLRRAGALIVLLAFATLSITTVSTARPSTTPSTLGPEAFQPVVVPDGPLGSPLPSFDLGSAASPVPIGDFIESAPSFGPRVVPDQPNRARSILKPTPRPTPRPVAAAPRSQATPRPRTSSGSSGGGTASSTGNRVTGTASWYCQAGVSACHYQYPSGMYAAAGPALRVGNWRGRTVRVCGNGSCVNVKLVDWCQCYGTRVIDLYSDAYRRLAPLSTGVQKVTVSW